MRYEEFVAALDEEGALSVGEYVVAVDPFARFAGSTGVMGICRAFKWADSEEIGQDKSRHVLMR